MYDFGLVSIVMPSYNSENYIKASIESVLNQTYPKWELLIVDDCSTDKTVEIIKSFKDERIKFFENDKNSGAAVSRNKALCEATGHWIAFLDSDDLWLPTKLEEQLLFMVENHYYFSFTDYRVSENGKLTNFLITGPNKVNFRKIKHYCYPATLTVVYDADKVGLIQVSSIKKNNDYAMWLRILKKVDGFRLPKALSIYNKHNKSISSGKKSKLVKWHYILFRSDQGYGRIHSVILTLENIWYGFLKKIFYKKRIKKELQFLDSKNNDMKKPMFKYLEIIILLIGSLSTPFLGGSFTKHAKLEHLSNRIALETKNNTLSGETLAVGVSATSKNGQIPKDESEFNNLYGVFRQENVTFASGFNTNKETNFKIPCLNETANYSVVYTGIETTVEYNKHFKHWYYPIEFMFPGKRLFDIERHVIYLSQGQANKILEDEMVEKDSDGCYRIEDYNSLVGNKFIYANVNGVEEKCLVGNIYFETNYYCKTLSEILGDYIICSYYCPGELQRQNIYFFNNYSYQNSYFINYINSVYAGNEYKIDIIRNNIKDAKNIDYILDFYYEDISSKQIICAILLLAGFILNISALLLVYLNHSFSKKSCIGFFAMSLFPYLVFFIISKITKSVLFFSNYGIGFYVLLMFLFNLVNIMFFILWKRKKRHLDFKDDFYSCNI